MRQAFWKSQLSLIILIGSFSAPSFAGGSAGVSGGGGQARVSPDGGITQVSYGPAQGGALFECRNGDEFQDRASEDSGRKGVVNFVCKNGKWIDPFAPPVTVTKPIVCKDGEEFVDSESSPSNRENRRLQICHNGKWVDEFPH